MSAADLQKYIPQQKYFERGYLGALISLLPKGSLWQNALGKISHFLLDNVGTGSESNSILVVMLSVFAKELERIDISVVDMWTQAVPGTSTDMLIDWENALGLPEEFTTPPTTVAERQDIAHAKYYADYRSGMSADFYIDYAATLGFVITIEGSTDVSMPFYLAPVGVDPYNIGARVEDRLNDSSQLNTVIINIISGPVDDTQLKLIFATRIPAHIVVVWVR